MASQKLEHERETSEFNHRMPIESAFRAKASRSENEVSEQNVLMSCVSKMKMRRAEFCNSQSSCGTGCSPGSDSERSVAEIVKEKNLAVGHLCLKSRSSLCLAWIHAKLQSRRPQK